MFLVHTFFSGRIKGSSMVKINSLGHILKYRGVLRANDAHFRSGNLMRKHVHIFIPERQYGHARVELWPYLSAYANITARAPLFAYRGLCWKTIPRSAPDQKSSAPAF